MKTAHRKIFAQTADSVDAAQPPLYDLVRQVTGESKQKKVQRPRGRPRGGVSDWVRRILIRHPQASNAHLRGLALAKFGWTPMLDRHFAGLAHRIRKELG